MHEYQPCCAEFALESKYRFCRQCGARFIRCPVCHGLLSALGHCARCLKPVIEIKTGMRLKEGALCNVPLKIGNMGSRPFTLRSLKYSVPGHTGPAALAPNMRLAAGEAHEVLGVAIKLDSAGEYALTLECEFDWEYGKRVGIAYSASAVATAVSRDALINTQGGTGNMIYISGEASTRIVEHQLERDSSSVHYRELAGRALSASDLREFGEAGAAVTLATKLALPDLYELSKGHESPAIELWPDAREGILLGRDKPGGSSRNHAALRVPTRVKDAAELTKQLSSTHWRIYPSEGRWWLEVLGRLPSLAGSKVLTRGQSLMLAEGAVISPFADRPSALRLQLKHVNRADGMVVASRLEIL